MIALLFTAIAVVVFGCCLVRLAVGRSRRRPMGPGHDQEELERMNRPDHLQRLPLAAPLMGLLVARRTGIRTAPFAAC